MTIVENPLLCRRCYPASKMVEPVTYFCTTSPVTAICFYQPRSQNSKKTLLLAGTGSGTLSSWDLTSCSLEQVFANSKESACNIFFINALESLSFKSATTLDAQCTIFLCLSKSCSPIVSFHWTFQKVLYREFLIFFTVIFPLKTFLGFLHGIS